MFIGSFVDGFINANSLGHEQIIYQLEFWRAFCEELFNIDYEEKIWIFENNFVSSIKKVIKLKSYDNLLNHVKYSPILNKVLLIQDHPGIGKSMFSICIMKKLMMENKSFLFSYSGEQLCFGWNSKKGAIVYTWQNVPVNDDLLWIMNKRQHGPYLSARCKMVLICSPIKENSKEFQKIHGVIEIYMPVPDSEEVEEMVSKNACLVDGKQINSNEIKRRIAVVGNIAKLVCSEDFDNEERKIKDALEKCDFKADIYNSVVKMEGETYLTNRIFCVNADINFKYLNTSFVSEEVARRYMQAWKKHDIKKSLTFIEYGHHSKALSIPYGVAFEEHMNSILSNGGDFCCKKLHGKKFTVPDHRIKVNTISFSKKSIQKIDNAVDFKTDMNDLYLQPKHGNFGAVDAMGLSYMCDTKSECCCLFQSTVNMHHGVNSKELIKLMKKINKHLEPRTSVCAKKNKKL
jgi:hypothetical protein